MDNAPHQHPRSYRRLIKHHPPVPQNILGDYDCQGEIVAEEEGGETGSKKGFIPDTVNPIRNRHLGKALGGDLPLLFSYIVI